MPKLPTALANLIQQISSTSDQYERAEMLIEIADRFKEVPEKIATRPYPQEHRAPHCESEAYVWMVENPDHSLKFYFAVDNPQGLSAKAMAVILDETLSGLMREQVLEVPTEIVSQIFGKDLSMGKGLGLIGMISLAKDFARRLTEGQRASNFSLMRS